MKPHRALRRLLPALAGTAAVAVALSGCTGSNNANGGEAEPQTITLAFGPANDVDALHWDALADAFEERHPGVTIKRERLPGESWRQVIQTRVQGGNAPDLFEVKSGGGQVGSLIPFAEAGLLLPLDDPQFAKNLPAGPEQWTHDGKVYGVPTNIATNGLVFNDTAASGLGIKLTGKESMEDLIKLCPKVRDAGKTMFVSAGTMQPSVQALALTLATSSVYGPDPDWNKKRASGEVKFSDSKGWRDAIETIVEMHREGCLQDGAAGAGVDAIIGGITSAKSLGLFTPSGAAKALNETSKGAVSLMVHPTPAPAGYDTYLSVSADFSIAGKAETKSPKLVTEFLKFLSSPEGTGVFATKQGSIPAVGADTSNLLPQYQPVADYLTNSSDKTRGWPPLDWPNAKILETLGSGVQGIYTGQSTVDDVLAKMDAEWD